MSRTDIDTVTDDQNIRASEKIWDQIRADILRGNYQNGTVLSEKELAERMQFSRTPVREALNKLENEGLITKSRNGGWTVKGLTEQDMIEVLYIRRFCERYVAGKAAQNINSEQEAELKMSINLMNEFVEIEDMDKVKKWFDRFNHLLVEASGVTRIRNILTRIYGYINHVARENLEDSERALRSCKEHELIAEAVINGNSEKAKALVDQHIQNVQDKIVGRRVGDYGE